MLRRKYRKIHNFLVLIKKWLKNDDKGHHHDDDDKKKKITHGLKFIDSFRFMPCKSSDLVDNLSGT